MKAEEVDPKGKEWRHLIGESYQSTLYTMPEWMGLHPVTALIAFQGSEPQGGMVVASSLTPLALVPYQGLLLLKREDKVASECLIMEAEKLKRPLSVWNAPHLVDIRPFTWRWFDSKVMWQHDIRYTYICHQHAQMEARSMANVTNAKVEREEGREWFGKWKDQPWVTDEISRLMEKILGFASVEVWHDGDAHVIWGTDVNKRGYYLGSVGKPTNVLASLIKRHDTTDLVGCNSPERALFKRGFGGALRTAYGMRLVQ